MKLYLITNPGLENEDRTELSHREYAGTQADARKVRITEEAHYKDMKPKDRPTVAVEEVDVPTDKAGLLAYLNKLVSA
jgi:hypothetical protein